MIGERQGWFLKMVLDANRGMIRQAARNFEGTTMRLVLVLVLVPA